MTLLDRLKRETRPAHDRIEREVDLSRITASPAAYRRLLERFYGFHAPWEARAGRVLVEPAFLERRLKTPLLARDLRALGAHAHDIRALPLCDALMPIATRADVFGAMYVLEGATLGGNVIARHVTRSLGLTGETGCAYFRSYGPLIGPMWKAFGEELLAFSSPETDDDVVASALKTFDRLQHWLGEETSPPCP